MRCAVRRSACTTHASGTSKPPARSSTRARVAARAKWSPLRFFLWPHWWPQTLHKPVVAGEGAVVVVVAEPAFHAAHQRHAQHRSQHHKGRNLHPTRRGSAGGGGTGAAKATPTARPARPHQTAERSANSERHLEPLMPDIIRYIVDLSKVRNLN